MTTPRVILALLSALLASSLVHSEELEIKPLVSVTGCVLKYPSSSPTVVLCDFAVFSTFPQPAISQPLAQSPNDGCAALPAGSLEHRVVLVPRGSCPFTTKARNLQAAGAAAVIIGNNEPGVLPLRMKGLGDEFEIVTVPVVMVGKEDYDALSDKVAAGGADEEVQRALLDVEMTVEHELAPERKFKHFLARPRRDGRYNPGSLMELGAYMIRSGWKEDGRLYIMEASQNADRPQDYQIQYSVGEYLNNIEKQPMAAKPYFEKCIKQIVEFLLQPAEETFEVKAQDDAWEKLHKMTGKVFDVYDNARQLIAVQDLVASDAPTATKWLKKLVESLAKRRILSTPTVMVWADGLERIGMHDLLDEAVNGEWYETHAGKQSEEWVETMAEVRIVLADYIKSLPPPPLEEEKMEEQHTPASAEL
jgi:hypothetical protein